MYLKILRTVLWLFGVLLPALGGTFFSTGFTTDATGIQIFVLLLWTAALAAATMLEGAEERG